MAIVKPAEVPKREERGADLMDIQGSITLTSDQIEQLGESIVQRTMVNMGYKPRAFQSGRIYRQEMLEVISIRQFEKARITGKLKTHKDGSRNSKIWARREDWERYLKYHTNRKS